MPAGIISKTSHIKEEQHGQEVPRHSWAASKTTALSCPTAFARSIVQQSISLDHVVK